jgi:hypothetical protein
LNRSTWMLKGFADASDSEMRPRNRRVPMRGQEDDVHYPDLPGPAGDVEASDGAAIGQDHIERRLLVVLPVVAALGFELLAQKRFSPGFAPPGLRQLLLPGAGVHSVEKLSVARLDGPKRHARHHGVERISRRAPGSQPPRHEPESPFPGCRRYRSHSSSRRFRSRNRRPVAPQRKCGPPAW